MTSDLDAMKQKMKRLAGRRTTASSGKERVPEVSITKVTRARKKKNGKAKGSTYERKIAKKLAKWTGDKLRRTPQSGGWGGAPEYSMTGDISCARKKFPLHIECKKHEKWCLEDLITGTRQRGITSLLSWWEQTTRTCPVGKIPWLVFARNHVPDLVMMYRRDMLAMVKGDFTVEFLPHYTFSMEGLKTGNGEVVIFALDDFTTKVKPPKGCRGRKKWKPPEARDVARAASINDNDSE